MTNPSADSRSVVVERELSHPPEKVWRALTEPMLIEEWLMKNDFMAVVDHHFDLKFEWGAVSCRVLEVHPPEKLVYTWNAGELRTTVTWTLTPTNSGTRLHMQQEGFKDEQPRYYSGARAGWPRFLEALERVLTQLD
ncbi:SRPBCC family protein [Bowmanella dokdonensis]|uniref:SRPBCC domain-containing protein n=1 Tax=Bowmanella dokdonensis TaxID=751969 RepID=A0A939DL77_9ALTE|nr:SRPBCC domain-containing protein [Bowmanella dokdonensis]MBN7823911.1 SRPBCC domain-containing protein [Bowmanella dokdonensis]